MDIIKKLAQELAIKEEQAKAAVQLIDEGNTIPFIARYRKEMTGALNDETLRNLHERLLYLRNLEEKKEQVINAITDQGKMTEDLKKKILSAETLVAVDDLYRPYRPKKQTRATKAKEKGLEPLANILLLQKTTKSMEEEAAAFVNAEKGVANAKEAIAGAKDIIAEMIADMADYRKSIRNCTMKQGSLVVKAKDEKAESVYEMYYDFREPLSKVTGYRVLAINRGEKEKFLTVKVEAPDVQIVNALNKTMVKDDYYGGVEPSQPTTSSPSFTQISPAMLSEEEFSLAGITITFNSGTTISVKRATPGGVIKMLRDYERTEGDLCIL